MSEPAVKPSPEESLPTLIDLKPLGWPEEALAREARLRAALPASRDAFRQLLAAIAG
jgi:hypothetical protein